MERSDFASFKMLPDGSMGLPSRDDRLDMYLENMMCDINKEPEIFVVFFV